MGRLVGGGRRGGIEAREHAYRGFKATGDRRGAARMALWLGLDHLEFRGELGGEARELGRSLDLVALEMMGLATEGLAMVEQGEVRSGMRCLDEASAAALGGEYEEDFPVCWTRCYLIYACERSPRSARPRECCGPAVTSR